jgi:cyclophilin family peptidyl-prolyl cis-trans isomerase
MKGGVWIAATSMAAALALQTLAGAAADPVADQRGTAVQGRGAAQPAPRRSPGAGPVIVFETVKGTFEIETYPNEAPRSVEHILALVKRNFYNGLRVHRVEPGFVIQFGDPQTRDMTKRDRWGTGGSGRSIGVAEISPKRPHKLGAVALAHRGDPREADSQMYIALNGPARYGHLEGDYAVFGQVISGIDVVQKLQMTDVIRRATVKGPAPGGK